MKIEKFVSGKFVSQSGYKSFLPSKINTGWDWDSAELSFLLEKASGELGGLNAFSDLIPNIDVY